MLALPARVAELYGHASSHDVRSWSFGAVGAGRDPRAMLGSEPRGALGDQRIFGPVRDYECACGRFAGKKYEGMICDRCGVKITSAASRSMRFGHVELGLSIAHPYAPRPARLEAWPILPASYFESTGGAPLGE